MSDRPDEDEERPRERRGAVRRDCEPHRGELIGFLGGTSLMLGVAAFCLVVTGLLAVPMGMAAWLMARRDLARMRAGVMDPRGEAVTRQGGSEGLVGVLLSLVVLGALMLLVAMLGVRRD